MSPFQRKLYILESSHPCTATSGPPCCHSFTEKMGHNLEAIMKVMRFANGRSQRNFNTMEFMKQFKNFPKYNLSDAPATMDTYEYLHTIIPSCDLKQSEVPTEGYVIDLKMSDRSFQSENYKTSVKPNFFVKNS